MGKPRLLARELATYERQSPRWRAEHQGRYALVHGDLVDCFQTYEDALKIGYERFGLRPFLIKEIQVVEQPRFVGLSLAEGEDWRTSRAQWARRARSST